MSIDRKTKVFGQLYDSSGSCTQSMLDKSTTSTKVAVGTHGGRSIYLVTVVDEFAGFTCICYMVLPS